ncbi:MAG: sulfite exporter TauE/SafE family protein [Gemmatimonadaceae bacterium]
MELDLAIAGLAIGFLIGLSGVGSGALMAPLLLLLGVSPATVVGTDIAFGLLTKSAGIGIHLRRKTIVWPWVRLLAIGSIPGALAGTFLVAQLAAAPHLLRAWIGIVLVVSPLAALWMEVARRRGAAWVSRVQRPKPWAISAIGFAIGVTVGATSVGSGTLVDVALILFSPLGGGQLVGTGIAHAVLLSGVASLAHWNIGTIDFALITNLLTGSVPGVLLGGWIATRTSPQPLRWGVAALVLLSGLTTLTGIYNS